MINNPITSTHLHYSLLKDLFVIMIENRLKHELYSSQFLRYLYLNTPLLIYPTETVLGTDGLMDGWIAH